MHRIIIYSILAFFTCAELWADNVVVEAVLDSPSIRIGEQVKMHTKVIVKKGTRVIFPEYAQGYLTEGVEVLERSGIDTATIDDNQRWVLSRSYLLTSFDSALYSLPPVEVHIGERTYSSTESLGLKVSSIEVDTVHIDNIRDPYGPIDVTFQWNLAFMSTLLLLWLFLIAFVISVCRLMKYEPLRQRITVAPPPPAHQVALQAIERFKSRTTDDEESLKAYYDDLTNVLRTYIAERFGIEAREMTTPQLIQALTSAEDQAALYDLRELLQTADLVKFARLQTSSTENDRSLLYAMEYVNQTKSTEPTPERITRIVDINRKKRQAKIIARALCAVVFGAATLGTCIYIIYSLIDTFR